MGGQFNQVRSVDWTFLPQQVPGIQQHDASPGSSRLAPSEFTDVGVQGDGNTTVATVGQRTRGNQQDMLTLEMALQREEGAPGKGKAGASRRKAGQDGVPSQNQSTWVATRR